MKKTILFLYLILLSISLKAQIIDVYPPNWYNNMVDSNLQIIIHAKNINQFKASINSNELTLINSIPGKHPDYLLINLKIGKNAKAGNKTILFKNKQKEIKLNYSLLEKPTRKVPSLEQNDLMYLLMPDRFANANTSNDVINGMNEISSNRKEPFDRHGGDLKGIQEHIPYLKELGATTLWLTPFQENNELSQSYHGYAITNHYKTDPRYGNNEDYKNLVNACHENGMKVLIDLVYNHIGDKNWMYEDLPFPSFIHLFDSLTKTNYRANTLMDPYGSVKDKQIFNEGWFDRHMPDLNMTDPLISKFMIQQTLWWLNEAKLDAIRIDTYSYPDESFMKHCYKEIRKEYPDISIFSEVWEHAVPVQSYFTPLHESKMNALQNVLDFQFCFAMDEFVQQPFGWTEGVSKLYYSLSQDYLYNDPYHHAIFIDNHDLDRFLAQVNGDVNKLKVALSVLFTMRGIPCLFYGTETLMKGKGPHGVIREDFAGGWKTDSTNKFLATGRSTAENDLWNYIQNLAQWRKTNDAIANGKLMQFVPNDGIYVYFRYTDLKSVMVIYNSNAKSKKIKLDRFSERINSKLNAKDIINKKDIKLDKELEMNANQLLILDLY